MSMLKLRYLEEKFRNMKYMHSRNGNRAQNRTRFCDIVLERGRVSSSPFAAHTGVLRSVQARDLVAAAPDVAAVKLKSRTSRYGGWRSACLRAVAAGLCGLMIGEGAEARGLNAAV
eukprot:IDg16996t1